MNGVDPYATMQQIAVALDRTEDPAGLNSMLDDLEYLFEVLDPELQSTAEGLMEQLRRRIAEVKRGRT